MSLPDPLLSVAATACPVRITASTDWYAEATDDRAGRDVRSTLRERRIPPDYAQFGAYEPGIDPYQSGGEVMRRLATLAGVS